MKNTNEITPTGYTGISRHSEGEHHRSENDTHQCYIYRSGDWLSITVYCGAGYRGNEVQMTTVIPEGKLTQKTIDQIVAVLELHADDITLLSRNIEAKHKEENDV